MNDCTSCKVINDEIPSYKVYENKKVYAFLDTTQVTKGHTLVVSKQHVTGIFGHNDVLASDVFARIPKVARTLEKAFPKMEGLDTLDNNKKMAYQSAFHLHVYLIPRYSKEDDFSTHSSDHQEDYSAEAVQEIAETIAKQVN